MKINELLSVINLAYGKQIVNFVLDGDFNYNDVISEKDAKTVIDISKDYDKSGGFNLMQSMSYDRGKTRFMGMPIYVKKGVVSPPSPSTEILTNAIIKHIRLNDCKDVLEIATGSGAIAIALAKHTNAKITGTDICPLDIAKINAKINGVDVNFIQSDMFKNVQRKYDVIAGNPPCSSAQILQSKPANVPDIARTAGKDGLKFIKSTIKNAPEFLKSGGLLCLKLCHEHTRNAIPKLIKKDNNYKNGKTFFDADGKPMAILCQH